MSVQQDPGKEYQRRVSRMQSRVRGLMLGLALGDTVGGARGEPPAAGPLRAGVSTQLACFTAEGVVRAMVRGQHKGICHPPGVVLHAYCRWAALQGIEEERMRRRWVPYPSDRPWPDGWLAGVPALAERRGSAPATVTALSRIEDPHSRIATPSRGCHALTRTLPVAVAGPHWSEQAGEFAALTHGDPAARSAAVQAAVLLQHALTAPRPDGPGDPAEHLARTALETGIAALPAGPAPGSDGEQERLHAAFRSALDRPAEPALLARLAPEASAPSALLGGLYTAASFPGRDRFRAALEFAAGAPDPGSVACVTGALLGAVHGAEALPVDLVSRHELGWVLDTLARDLLAQIEDSPGGSEYVPGWDPHWWDRYPGW
ncbi:ADP-ribosylglycohydrolase family protein [Streptomyces cyanogenus]|uniref:ADP-ribosylglycohydrolase n=1 Tax=Streptomyces cyanogenus TaxID=80860 RepID=A0ABX7U2X0_STRCY|nr:ADP-ribosylglycohydrolase family protein [Streptomyces cyanogenus]QTE02154.1 ADP-ribosylglycohydrolase [Streptomyces cyanogenus]